MIWLVGIIALVVGIAIGFALGFWGLKRQMMNMQFNEQQIAQMAKRMGMNLNQKQLQQVTRQMKNMKWK
jgi:uncharacterized protein YneF (UPF0154 family)